MSDLHNKKCIPCEGGIPGFDITEIHKYLKMVDGWKVEADESKIYYLIKDFKFKNFLESQNFVNKVGKIEILFGKFSIFFIDFYYNKLIYNNHNQKLKF